MKSDSRQRAVSSTGLQEHNHVENSKNESLFYLDVFNRFLVGKISLTVDFRKILHSEPDKLLPSIGLAMDEKMRTQEELKSLKDENFRRYQKHLHHGLDITSIILKGHLFAEELLMDILKLHCRDSKPIENIQLSFHHKLKLVQAFFGSHLSGFQCPEKIWPVLDNLNQLRNALAHQIDSPKAIIRLNAFISSTSQLINKDVKIKVTEAIPLSDKSLANELIGVIFYLLGFLGSIHGVAYLNPPFLSAAHTTIRIPDAID